MSNAVNTQSSKSLATPLTRFLRAHLSLDSLGSTDEIHKAGSAVLSLLPVQPKAVKELAYKKLHVFPFKDVPLCWRRAFEEACLWDILLSLERWSLNFHQGDDVSFPIQNASRSGNWADDAIKLCDRAIIFTGAPGRRKEIDLILEWIELHTLGKHGSPEKGYYDQTTPSYDVEKRDKHRTKRQRLSPELPAEHSIPDTFPTSGTSIRPFLSDDLRVERRHCPTLSEFQDHVQSRRTPIIINGALSHWPAAKLWRSPKYWLQKTLDGKRLVPVELGKSYTDDAWGQKIMPFENFMKKYLLQILNEENEHGTVIEASPVGYLAQHDLFAQIPDLRKDFIVPDYCFVDSPESKDKATAQADSCDSSDGKTEASSAPEPLLNIWLGPANTVSPAHTDPHHNILAQVVGRKYVRLFDPSQQDKLYPMNKHDTSVKPNPTGETENSTHGVDMGNTSRVDVGSFMQLTSTTDDDTGLSQCYFPSSFEIEKEKFPEHASADFVETILEAGDCLYIPKGWWHYICSLETSCNVSFWWD